jgi:hypothetical protein
MTLQILSDLFLDFLETQTTTRQDRSIYDHCFNDIKQMHQKSASLEFTTDHALCYENYLLGHNNGVPGLIMFLERDDLQSVHNVFKMFGNVKRVAGRDDLILEVHPAGTRTDLGFGHIILIFVPHISSFTQEFEDMYTPFLEHLL